MAWPTPVARAVRAVGAALPAVPLLVLGPGLVPHAAAATAPVFAAMPLVSNTAGVAPVTDPNLVNPWGLALSATSPMWVANNGTNTSTLYAGGNATTPVSKAALTVTIPGGAPTGQIFNDTAGFVVTGPTGASGPARFLFVSEDGDLTGWSPAAAPTAAILAAHSDGAVYKGMALLHTEAGAFILAVDLAHGRIDVYDSTFTRLPAGTFRDTHLPAGYMPFNVAVIGGFVYVTYALVGADGNEVHAPGLGFVDRFDGLGLAPHRVAGGGRLNAPWGLAIAPASFGAYAGDLLVGNFGDGRINVYEPAGRFLDQLRDVNGQPITIDGLWALTPGTANTGGVDSVWFSAGPDSENGGLLGVLRPTG